MLLLIVYRLVRRLFGLLAVLVRSDLSKDAELLVLRHGNQVLRRQLSGRRRWDHADGLWLAPLSRLVSRRRWPETFPVTPATILRWHRDLARKWTYPDWRRPGRPSTGTSVKTLIIRMARQNPAWGTGGSRASWRGLAMRSRRPREGDGLAVGVAAGQGDRLRCAGPGRLATGAPGLSGAVVQACEHGVGMFELPQAAPGGRCSNA